LGGTRFLPVAEPTFKWPFQAKNPQQLMALNLLLDDNIQFLTLMGPAGTGKTFLALLAGLHKVLVEEQFQKMLVSRPVVPLGRDVGFLPGELKEKLHNWMLPIYDNMEFITHSTFKSKHDQEQQHGEDAHAAKHKGKGKHKKHNHKEHRAGGLVSLEELINRGKVSLEAITYMRGRSIPYQFILIDEAQNLTPHEVKALVTRVGAGSKIVLTGDPYQIDSPYLDFSSNGLITTSERFKGQGLFGSVFLSISERSELSKIAGELL
jgi:PhoH-like ATPase